MCFSELGSKPDSLVGVRRRHPDVRQHDVRAGVVDGCTERIEVLAGGDQFDLGVGFQDAPDPRAGQVAVLSDHYSEHQSMAFQVPRDSACELGIRPMTAVPRPDDTNSSSPPTAPMRSRMLLRPTPSADAAVFIPIPSSAIANWISPF